MKLLPTTAAMAATLLAGTAWAAADQLSSTPSTATLPFQYTLYSDSQYTYTIAWGLAQSNSQWNVQVSLTSLPGAPALLSSYTALGFGYGMLNAQFILCHNQAQASPNQVFLNEHISSGQYAPPPILLNQAYAVNLTGGFSNKTFQQCTFTRPLNPKDGFHTVLSATSPFNMVWSFNPTPGINYYGLNMTNHGPNFRGAVEADLSSGAMLPSTVQNFTMKSIHGLGMLSIWLLLLPFGAFNARYLRSLSSWLLTKVLMQITGVIGMFVMLIIVILAGAWFDKSHSYLGCVILSLVGVQFTLGLTNLIGMSNETADKLKVVTKVIHRVLGYTLFGLVIAQMGLGINILYPWVEPRYPVVWGLYFAGVIAWILTFAWAEYYFFISVLRKDKGYSKIPLRSQKVDRDLVGAMEMKGRKKGGEKKGEAGTTVGRKYTWEMLDHAINDGAMLVVGNGKYVYDISKWITSHPGGQVILQSVNGTDVTNDYFHESGYDAAEFTPKAKVPEKKKEFSFSTVAGVSSADMVSIRRRVTLNQSISSVEAIEPFNPNYTQDDWNSVQRARRTHVHTRLAVQRLATLVVGELVSQGAMNASGTTLDQYQGDNDVTSFDSYEYRRYAMTSNLITSQPNATKPCLKLRFCLLYPFDIRDGQPKRFEAGQCIEIQVRLASGERVCRYYTPISGDMNAFEIIVNVQPHGMMTQNFLSSKRGEKQFKIRGPFGTSFMNTKLFYTPTPPPVNTIYFFAGGSGITPALQCLQQYYLATNTRQAVFEAYQSTMSDEINVNPGDVLTVNAHYGDGWAFAYNHSTRLSGTFPVGCLYPVAPIRFVLIAIADLDVDVMGQDIIDAAKLAYPALVACERFNSVTFSADKVGMVLDNPVGNKIIVCGPQGLNARVMDILTELGSQWMQNVTVLTSDKYL